MDSAAMKQVRILTGAHAGAQLLLESSSTRIGQGSEFDIDLDDWAHAPIEVAIEEGDVVSVYMLTPNETADSGDASQTEVQREFLGQLVDFVPRRFVDVVLCCGPAEGIWPSDVSLMEQLMQPLVQVVEHLPEPVKKMGWKVWAAVGTCCVALVGGLSVVLVRQSDAASQRIPQESLFSQVYRAIEKLPYKDLVVSRAGEQVVVEGMLENASQVLAVRAALVRFPKHRLAHRYAAADQAVNSITEALKLSSLNVQHTGGGVFVVTGQAPNLQQLRDATQRIVNDLNPLVKRIDINVTELPAPDRIAVGSVMALGDLQVVEARNGAKYLTLIDTPPPAETLIETDPSAAADAVMNAASAPIRGRRAPPSTSSNAMATTRAKAHAAR
jgi:type III secretion protein D